tara:strand:+ start:1506 stop:1763 length:258 start_codon:yes stop_codon:yes gene_type:complete
MSKYSRVFQALRRLLAKKEIVKQTKYIDQRFGKDNLNPIDDNIPLDKNRNIDFQRLDTEKKKITDFLNKKNKKSMGGAVGPNGIL